MATHVLFDFDGTLVNTIDSMVQVATDIIERNGSKITDELKDCVPNLITFQQYAMIINEKLNLNLNPEEFKKEIFSRVPKTKLQLMPGVEKFVKHLHQHNIPMAIATGTLKVFYDEAILNFGDFFPKHFSHTICAWDDPEVVNKKPHPDCYLVAAKRFVPPPQSMKNVLIFEDSITGLKGALASGGITIFVNDKISSFNDANADIINKADLNLKTMEEFKPEQFGLPPY